MKLTIAELGWDAGFAASYTPFIRPDHRPARVTRVDRGIYGLLAADGATRAGLGGGMLTQAARDPLALPCTGDWVVLRAWPDQRTTIEAILPRRTRIIRASAGGESHGQVLAANIDVVAVVEALDPEPNLVRIERLLAVTWASGAVPVVILTKADLVRRPDRVAAQVAEVAPGVEVVPVSAQRGTGLDRLRSFVGPGRTLGLLGAGRRPGGLGRLPAGAPHGGSGRLFRRRQVDARERAARRGAAAHERGASLRRAGPAHDHPSRAHPAAGWRRDRGHARLTRCRPARLHIPGVQRRGELRRIPGVQRR